MKDQLCRQGWVDSLKGLLIVLVVVGHIISGNEREQPLYSFIYTFHMPLFFMISGSLSTNLSDRRACEYVKKKFRTLILPYLSFAIIGSMICGKEAFPSYFLGSIKGGYWFLPCLFVFSILLMSLCKLSNRMTSLRGYRTDALLLLGATSLLGLLYILIPDGLQALFIPGTLFLYWPYYALGYFVSRYNFNMPSWIIGVSAVIFMIIWYGGIEYNISNKPAYQLSRLCAVIFLYYCFKIDRPVVSILSVIGKNSLCVYLMHYFFIGGICDYVIIRCGNIRLFEICSFLFVSVIISIVCIIIKRLLSTNRYLGFLLFGQSLNTIK